MVIGIALFVFFALGITTVVALLLYSQKRPRPEKKFEPQPNSAAMTLKGKILAGCALAAFGLGWSACTLAADIAVAKRVGRQWRTSHYVPVEGEIIKCAVAVRANDESTSYLVEAEYTYDVRNQRYTGRRAAPPRTWSRTRAEQFARDHPPGSRVTVFY